jgi:putative transposase
MSLAAEKLPYAGYRFPAEVISHAVWLYFRFPLALRMVEELLAARGIRSRIRPSWRLMVPIEGRTFHTEGEQRRILRSAILCV